MEAIDIYSYLDYRAFCRDFYHFKKKSEAKFSYRSFARKTSVAPAHLKHVIDGKRNLSSEMSIRFGRGMGLSEKEVDYFENLVRFNQGHSVEEKNLYFERLRRQRARSLKIFTLAEAARLLSHWYVVAIKEIVVNLNSCDVKVVQKILRKKLPENLIQRTIEDLREMGWLQLKDNRWTSSASQMKFPDEVKSFVIQSFHHQMLELSVEALEDELHEREYQAAIFTFPDSELPALKQKVKDLQEDLVAFVQDIANKHSEDPDLRVFYYGAQCFALQNKTVQSDIDERGMGHA